MQLLQCESLRVCIAVAEINCFTFTAACFNSVSTFQTALLLP